MKVVGVRQCEQRGCDRRLRRATASARIHAPLVTQLEGRIETVDGIRLGTAALELLRESCRDSVSLRDIMPDH
jgi:hypothetical protein